MYSNMHDETLEGIIEEAFNEYAKKELEKLPSDEELAKMFPVSQKSLRKAQRRIKVLKHRKAPCLTYLRRAAAVVLTCTLLSFGIMMTSEKARAKLTGDVVEWFDEFAKIDFSYSAPNKDITAESDTDRLAVSDETASATDVQSFSDAQDTGTAQDTEATTEYVSPITLLEIGYIPEGLNVTVLQDDERGKLYVCESETDRNCIIHIAFTANTGIGVDTEYTEHEEMIINGLETHIFYNYPEGAGTLVMGNKVYTISIGGIIEREELIKIAENIKN